MEIKQPGFIQVTLQENDSQALCPGNSFTRRPIRASPSFWAGIVSNANISTPASANACRAPTMYQLNIALVTSAV